MKIEFDIYHPDEFEALASFATALAAGQRQRYENNPKDCGPAGVVPVSEGTAPPASPEPEKKTRAKKAVEPKNDPKPETAAPANDDKPAEVTEEEVRNAILDLLNEWSDFDKSRETPDPEVRKKQLKPILDRFGVEGVRFLFTEVDKAKWGEILDSVEASRAELAKLKGDA